MTLSPAAQYTSPPKESAVSQNDVYFHQTGEQDVKRTHALRGVPARLLETVEHREVLQAGIDH